MDDEQRAPNGAASLADRLRMLERAACARTSEYLWALADLVVDYMGSQVVAVCGLAPDCELAAPPRSGLNLRFRGQAPTYFMTVESFPLERIGAPPRAGWVGDILCPPATWISAASGFAHDSSAAGVRRFILAALTAVTKCHVTIDAAGVLVFTPAPCSLAAPSAGSPDWLYVMRIVRAGHAAVMHAHTHLARINARTEPAELRDPSGEAPLEDVFSAPDADHERRRVWRQYSDLIARLLWSLTSFTWLFGEASLAPAGWAGLESRFNRQGLGLPARSRRADPAFEDAKFVFDPSAVSVRLYYVSDVMTLSGGDGVFTLRYTKVA